MRSWHPVSHGCHGGGICAASMTLWGNHHSFVWQAFSVHPRTSSFSKTAGQSLVAQISPVAFWKNMWPRSPIGSWRISSEVGCVLVEKKHNQFLGIPRQREGFVTPNAQLQDLSRLVLWKTLHENDKPFQKVPLGASESFRRRKTWG